MAACGMCLAMCLEPARAGLRRACRLQASAIAGVPNDRFERRRHDARGDGRCRNAARRGDQRANGAIESPLRAESATTARGQLEVGVGRARSALQNLERDGGGQFRASERQSQAVAGHRIDEAGRIAGQQQARARRRPRRRPPSARASPAARRRARAQTGAAGPRRSAIDRRAVVAAPARRVAPAWCGTTRHALARPPGSGATPR